MSIPASSATTLSDTLLPAAALSLPAMTLMNSRRRADRSTTWDAGVWMSAVLDSGLKRPVKRTLAAMLESARGSQYTDVDRQTIAGHTGISRVATISDHWSRARDHGLLTSRQRYNGSSRHKLTVPWLEPSDIDDLDMNINTNTHSHIWTPAEQEWWERLELDSPSLPPWGEGMSPF